MTHTYLYTVPGVYTVTLTVSGLGGSDTLTRTGYITVTWPIISRVITYTYDDLYRLVDADYSSGEQFQYDYDAVGNRTVHTQTITSTTVTTYTYDAANRLDYFYEDGVQTNLTWDDNCNLLTQVTRVYTWDAANRLVWANVGGVISTFAYNGLGQRTSQMVGGVTTEYVLDTSAGLSAGVVGGLPEVIVATSGGTSTYPGRSPLPGEGFVTLIAPPRPHSHLLTQAGHERVYLGCRQPAGECRGGRGAQHLRLQRPGLAHVADGGWQDNRIRPGHFGGAQCKRSPGGLPEVIVATSGGASTYYVQVSGQILAQYGSGAWAYALPDHLGSVRQLTAKDLMT